MQRRLIIGTSSLMAWPTSVSMSHPGHGAEVNPYGFLHHLTSPEHLIGGLLGIAAVVSAGWLVRRFLLGRLQRDHTLSCSYGLCQR